MDMSEKIRTLRKKRGLTLEAVGEHVGVGKSTVRKWENGDIKNMRRDKIALLAEALGVSPGYLMGWVDEATSEKNDQLAKLIVKLRTDSDFYNTVVALAELNEKQYRGVQQLISAFDE